MSTQVPTPLKLRDSGTGILKQRANDADSTKSVRTRVSVTWKEGADAGYYSQQTNEADCARTAAADAEILRTKLTKLAEERAARVKLAKENAEAEKEANAEAMRNSPWGMPCPHYKCFCGGKTEESREFLKTGKLPPEPKYVNVQDRVKAIFALKPSTTTLDDGCVVVTGFVPGVPIPAARLIKADVDEPPPNPATAKRPVFHFDDPDLIRPASPTPELHFATASSELPQKSSKQAADRAKPPRRATSGNTSSKKPVSGGKAQTSKPVPEIKIVPAEFAESAILTEEEESDAFDIPDLRLPLKERMRLAPSERVQSSRNIKLPAKGILKTSRSVSIDTVVAADEDGLVALRNSKWNSLTPMVDANGNTLEALSRSVSAKHVSVSVEDKHEHDEVSGEKLGELKDGNEMTCSNTPSRSSITENVEVCT